MRFSVWFWVWNIHTPFQPKHTTQPKTPTTGEKDQAKHAAHVADCQRLAAKRAKEEAAAAVMEVAEDSEEDDEEEMCVLSLFCLCIYGCVWAVWPSYIGLTKRTQHDQGRHRPLPRGPRAPQ